MEVSLDPELPVQHFNLALLEVDDADWLFRVFTLVILKHIGITTHSTSSEHEPAFPPCLWERGANSSQLNISLFHLHHSVISHTQSWEFERSSTSTANLANFYFFFFFLFLKWSVSGTSTPVSQK